MLEPVKTLNRRSPLISECERLPQCEDRIAHRQCSDELRQVAGRNPHARRLLPPEIVAARERIGDDRLRVVAAQHEPVRNVTSFECDMPRQAIAVTGHDHTARA